MLLFWLWPGMVFSADPVTGTVDTLPKRVTTEQERTVRLAAETQQELKELIAAETVRKQTLLKETQAEVAVTRALVAERERLMARIKRALTKLNNQYTALRDSNLTMLALDDEAAQVFAQSKARLKQTREALTATASPGEMEKALATAADQITLFKSTLMVRRRRAAVAPLKALGPLELAVIKTRALQVVLAMRADLDLKEKAEQRGGKIGAHLSSLQARLRRVDRGLRELKEAGSSQQVREILQTIENGRCTEGLVRPKNSTPDSLLHTPQQYNEKISSVNKQPSLAARGDDIVFLNKSVHAPMPGRAYLLVLLSVSFVLQLVVLLGVRWFFH
jgi:hypothetical protein